MLDVGRHPMIDILAYSELESVEGESSSFKATIRKKSRYVNASICNACGDCVAKCPVKVKNEFDMNFGVRKAIYQYFPQGIPSIMTIDGTKCLKITQNKCGICSKACVKGAIDYEMKDETVEIEVASIIIATGFDMLPVSHLTQYGYGKIKNVITGLEYERLINATGPTEGHLYRPSDKKLAHKVAYLQCIGSRDQNNCAYCSSVCCMYSIKDAMLAKEHDSEAEGYIFHTDFRNVGKWFQNYEKKGKNDYDIKYIRGRAAEITEDADNNPIVFYEDTKTQEIRQLTVDLVVLATATIPSKGFQELARKLRIETGKDGFVQTNSRLPVSTSRKGIFACGFCIAPADIPESVAQGAAAAGLAAQIALSRAG